MKFPSSLGADALTKSRLTNLEESLRSGSDSAFQQIIDWLFVNDFVLDGFFSSLEPLLRKEVSLVYSIKYALSNCIVCLRQTFIVLKLMYLNFKKIQFRKMALKIFHASKKLTTKLTFSL